MFYIVYEQPLIVKKLARTAILKLVLTGFSVDGECPPMKVALDDEESVFANAEIRKFQTTPISLEGKSKLKTLAYLDRGKYS